MYGMSTPSSFHLHWPSRHQQRAWSVPRSSMVSSTLRTFWSSLIAVSTSPKRERHHACSSSALNPSSDSGSMSCRTRPKRAAASSQLPACCNTYPRPIRQRTLSGSCARTASRTRSARPWCLGGKNATNAVPRMTLKAFLDLGFGERLRPLMLCANLLRHLLPIILFGPLNELQARFSSPNGILMVGL